MKYAKGFFNGLCFMFLYILTILCAPIILLLMGYRDFKQKPDILGFDLYVIEIADTNFYSHATILGIAISFFIGVLIYVLFLFLFKKSNKKILS